MKRGGAKLPRVSGHHINGVGYRERAEKPDSESEWWKKNFATRRDRRETFPRAETGLQAQIQLTSSRKGEGNETSGKDKMFTFNQIRMRAESEKLKNSSQLIS